MHVRLSAPASALFELELEWFYRRFFILGVIFFGLGVVLGPTRSSGRMGSRIHANNDSSASSYDALSTLDPTIVLPYQRRRHEQHDAIFDTRSFGSRVSASASASASDLCLVGSDAGLCDIFVKRGKGVTMVVVGGEDDYVS
ncbi:hypothetical protein SODALDRAFT_379354 [Sodiomyces alkalinus F11]|uniref:Uncharacterized protein n=1 Tax=Sodiomyces alkalinus (strain CBS 110278 / VKM F-3762 / F11) TaxID=1314773 RepID=A0A3N2PUE7_SODAK|nr:hypothetical protein SODALDRAFT_379354 [Sodiomyces alkalinus F11]ROT38138.1 hypothetical protein SODALDRAFT_379354 [Sodiomyces alkalinus F11]